MNLPLIGNVDIKSLVIGIVFAMFVWPFLATQLRRL